MPAAVTVNFKSIGDVALPFVDKLNSATLLKVVVPNATPPDKVRLAASIKKLVKLTVPVDVVNRKPLPLCTVVPANEADKSPPLMGNVTTGMPPGPAVDTAVLRGVTVTPAPVSVGADTKLTVVTPPTTGTACAWAVTQAKAEAKTAAAGAARSESIYDESGFSSICHGRRRVTKQVPVC